MAGRWRSALFLSHSNYSFPPLDVSQVVCSSGGGGSELLLDISWWRRCRPRALPCWSAAAAAAAECQGRMWCKWRPLSLPSGMTALWRSLGLLLLLLLLLLQPPSVTLARLPTAPPAGRRPTCVQPNPCVSPLTIFLWPPSIPLSLYSSFTLYLHHSLLLSLPSSAALPSQNQVSPTGCSLLTRRDSNPSELRKGQLEVRGERSDPSLPI